MREFEAVGDDFFHESDMHDAAHRRAPTGAGRLGRRPLRPVHMQGDHVYSDHRLVISRTDLPGILSISGEIDQFNADAVAAALDGELRGVGAGVADPRQVSRPGRQLRIDVSRLEFVDTGGIRALVKIADGAGDRLPLVLSGLPPLLRKVMFAVGWGDLPGLVIAESESELHDSSAA